MKVGDLIRLNNAAVDVFGLNSNIGLIMGLICRDDDWPDDYEVLADGVVRSMGFQIESSAKVISEKKNC